jgi:type IV pilus assembly protein PilV
MKRHHGNDGFMLLEALVAIFVFSLGILGVIAFQGASSRLTTDAAFRSEASLYADELVALMNVSSPATLTTDFASPGGASFVAWKAARLANLPSSDATVTLTADPSGTTNTVVAAIVITWRPPGVATTAEATANYAYSTTALIGY